MPDVLSELWTADQYQLIDFGDGRKLERFGALILDRPCPAADNARQAQPTAAWSAADLALTDREPAGELVERQQRLVEDWRVRYEQVQFQLRLTPFGHVGLFPEHAAQWHWLRANVRHPVDRVPSLLNLFAYTGGASLTLASQGWQVTHVDASEPTVQWARHNAEISGLTDAPVRWLVEDARVYVARELKRGRRYDAILLDPPSYGHGPKGKAWQIERDLPDLLEQCCELLVPTGLLILTGHSDSVPVTASDLIAMRTVHAQCEVTAETSRVNMSDVAKRTLDFGWCVRVT